MGRSPSTTGSEPTLSLSMSRAATSTGSSGETEIGSQTRRHADLDIVIEAHHVPVAVAALQRRGYALLPRPDTRPWNFVLGDDTGHQINFHVIVLDEHGSGVYGPPENGESHPSEALTGKGSIKGRTVDCITPEWLVRFHASN
jgi:lincosamide nucleotidyltransferase A/C/D/E